MYPVRNCTRHSAMVHSDKVHHHHLTQSVRTDIQPHPATAVTPSNTSWFTSTFNLRLSPHSTSSSHSRHSVTHISDSVHADIQPHPHTGALHTSTGSTHPNSTTSTHRWSHHRAHPQAAHVCNTQSNHTIVPICALGERKKKYHATISLLLEYHPKVPRNHIITFGIPKLNIQFSASPQHYVSHTGQFQRLISKARGRTAIA